MFESKEHKYISVNDYDFYLITTRGVQRTKELKKPPKNHWAIAKILVQFQCSSVG